LNGDDDDNSSDVVENKKPTTDADGWTTIPDKKPKSKKKPARK
jgi:hypothetical protein